LQRDTLVHKTPSDADGTVYANGKPKRTARENGKVKLLLIMLRFGLRLRRTISLPLSTLHLCLINSHKERNNITPYTSAHTTAQSTVLTAPRECYKLTHVCRAVWCWCGEHDTTRDSNTTSIAGLGSSGRPTPHQAATSRHATRTGASRRDTAHAHPGLS
jgi:hypothetical protein